MKTEEKLKVALEALKTLSEPWLTSSTAKYAAKVYAELTAPKLETVEVKQYTVLSKNGGCLGTYHTTDEASKVCHPGFEIIELTGAYTRPIPEPEEEVWEGKVHQSYSHNYGYLIEIPTEFVGKTVEVRLK